MKPIDPIYIAASGMITPIGANSVMTLTAVNAGINRYQLSEFSDDNHQPIALARVPDEIFAEMQTDIDTGDNYSIQYDRIIKMAMIAAQQAVANNAINTPIPLILAMPEAAAQDQSIPKDLLINNLVKQANLPIDANQVYTIHTGRAAGIQCLDLAQRYLHQQQADYVLVGASDSYLEPSLLASLQQDKRLKTSINRDGFVGGEAASFLLLSRHPELAAPAFQGIALHSIAEAQEPGHLYSEAPSQGEGLHQAATKTLAAQPQQAIKAIYSSMNGEHFWSKELGVLMARHSQHFSDDIRIEHPADSYGDLGTASGPILVALAAYHLQPQTQPGAYLLYSSSDGAWRATMLIEKLI